jgi:NADPH2:quinone reductase
MKAIIVNPDKSLSWKDVGQITVNDNEVLIKTSYAAVNRADLMQREGNYPPPTGAPEWMGLEVSGIIAEMGKEAAEQSDWRIGDRVCTLLGGGGYAEYAAVRYDQLLPIPKGLTMAEAAVLPEVYSTAYLNLFIEGKAKPGETLLMNAGASGLASAVIPMAKSFGLYVITTVRRSESAGKIKNLGADRIVDTSSEDITAVLAEYEAKGKPVDIAIDCLGGEIMGSCLNHMAHDGRWIIISSLAGNSSEVDFRVILRKNLRIIGSTLRSRTADFKADLLKKLKEDIWPLLESKEITTSIYKILPIEETDAAHKILKDGGHVGKVVLSVSREE